jgi:hypothetical protein
MLFEKWEPRNNLSRDAVRKYYWERALKQSKDANQETKPHFSPEMAQMVEEMGTTVTELEQTINECVYVWQKLLEESKLLEPHYPVVEHRTATEFVLNFRCLHHLLWLYR